MKPTKEEIKEALEAISKLCMYEGTMRRTRGWGAFKEEELPIPGLVKVIAWLEEEVKND